MGGPNNITIMKNSFSSHALLLAAAGSLIIAALTIDLPVFLGLFSSLGLLAINIADINGRPAQRRQNVSGR
jgi:hypothetical protein